MTNCRFWAIAATITLTILTKHLLGYHQYPFALSVIAIALITHLGGVLIGVGAFITTLIFEVASGAEASPWRLFFFCVEGLGAIALIARAERIAAQNNQLIRNATAKNDFFDSGSHRMKGHITVIQLSVGLLRDLLNRYDHRGVEARGGMEKITTFLSTLDQESDRLVALVCDLLKLQELDLRGVEPGQDTIKLPEWLDMVVDCHQGIAAQHQISITLDCLDCTISGDAQILSDIANELLLNACKYTPTGGAIRVYARRMGSKFILEVANTAPDIPPETLSRLFEPYYRGRNDGTGSGLGLAIVRRQVELLGGTISASSDNGWVRLAIALPAGKQ